MIAFSTLRQLIVSLFFVATFAHLGFAAEVKPLVEADWLARNLTTQGVTIVDLRSEVDGGGRKAYEAGHIPGSVHSDYLNAGWRQTRNNVPGLFPDTATLERLFGELGLEKDTHVILVPAGVNPTDFGSAARAYWTLKAAGHSKVSILNGGYAAWSQDKARPIASGASPVPTMSIYDVEINKALIAEAGEIETLLSRGKPILIDSRPVEFHMGREKASQAERAGHIPGSINRDTYAIYDETTNKLKPLDQLRAFFASVPEDPAITYCNSGQWSATNWFVMSELLGRKNVRMFPGSMVEWTAKQSRPVATGESRAEASTGKTGL